MLAHHQKFVPVPKDFKPIIAFNLRVYNPPGEHKMSHLQIYVADAKGHERRITFLHQDCNDLSWTGPHSIAFSLNKKRLVDFDLYSGKLRTLESGIKLSWSWQRHNSPNRRPVNYQIGNSIYRIINHKLIPRSVFAPGTSIWTSLANKVINRPGSKGQESLKIDSQQQTLTYFQSKNSTVLLDGNNDSPGGFFTFKGHPYYISDIGNSTLWDKMSLFRFHWKTGESQLLAKGRTVDFDLRKIYWGVLSRRNMVDYGPSRQLWNSQVSLLNSQTGKSIILDSGSKYSTNVRMSPWAP